MVRKFHQYFYYQLVMLGSFCSCTSTNLKRDKILVVIEQKTGSDSQEISLLGLSKEVGIPQQQFLRAFSAFFIPFYFCNSGLKIAHEAFSINALVIAFVLLIISGPIKIVSILIHRRVSMNESWKDSFGIAVSLMPNLVFGLVLADILKTKMDLPIEIFGGLIIYTLGITLLSPMQGPRSKVAI